MKTYIIQLDAHDDALSTQDKMAWSKAPRILLVWPRKGQILGRSVDLVILQRRAHILGAQLGIVTSDSAVRANAVDAGVPSFSSAVQAQSGSWRKPRSARKPNWRNFHPRAALADLRKQRELLHAQPLEDQRTRLIAFSIGILAVMVMALFFLPAATIELSPQRAEQRLTLQVWASPEIRDANPSGGLPAFAVAVVVEGSAQQPSSGRVGIPERQASGNVEFSNLTEGEIKLPAGTVVLARGDGDKLLRFETTLAAVLPAGVGKKVTAAVRAQLPGISGNIRAGAVEAVEGLLGSSVLAENLAAFQGGSERRSPAPQSSDYLAAEEQLKKDLRASALDDLERKLAPGERLVEGTLVISKILKDTREPAPGQPADFARLSQQLEYTAWYVKEQDLDAVARTALEANRAAGFQPLEGSLQIDFAEDVKMDENGVAHWEMSVYRQLEAVWSDTQAAQAVVGRSPNEAARILGQQVSLSSPPRFKMVPYWWQRLPFLSFRIAVVRQ
jgi:hypothetical protein